MSGWVLELDGGPRLMSARISHMLSVMRAERVTGIAPEPDGTAWAGITEDGRTVRLRPVENRKESDDADTQR